MTHAPEAEKPLVDEGWLTHRVQFMHNDYVLVGPEADPAKIAATCFSPSEFEICSISQVRK